MECNPILNLSSYIRRSEVYIHERPNEKAQRIFPNFICLFFNKHILPNSTTLTGNFPVAEAVEKNVSNHFFENILIRVT